MFLFLFLFFFIFFYFIFLYIKKYRNILSKEFYIELYIELTFFRPRTVARALELAQKINGMSLMATRMAKDAVNAAYELGLSEGVKYEKRVFWGTFATHDQKEGMTAFIEKRKPDFKDN